MSQDTFRTISLERSTAGRYVVRNVRGGSMEIGTGGDNSFTPVELLRSLVTVTGDKVRDEGGNRMENLAVEFRVVFPEGSEGDAAREALPRSVRMSHDRLCTVSRTVELGTPVTTTIAPVEP